MAGGNGYGDGAGGSGGRIAVHIAFDNIYGGQYLTNGGLSGNESKTGLSVGGPGTMYKFESNRGPQYRELKYNPRLNRTAINPEHSKLLVHNADLDTDNPAMVMEKNTVYYDFSEVEVEGYAYVEFYDPDDSRHVNVVIQELTGNKKGLVRVRKGQRLVVNFVESTHTYLDAPCGIHVDKDGEAVLPTTVIVTSEAVIIEGQLTGVEQLYVERHGEFICSSECHSDKLPDHPTWYALTPDDTYTPALLGFQTVDVANEGRFTLDNDLHTGTLIAGDLTVHSGGQVHCKGRNTLIEASNMTIEKLAAINGTGSGYANNEGPGAGHSTQYEGSGGAHAGLGKYDTG